MMLQHQQPSSPPIMGDEENEEVNKLTSERGNTISELKEIKRMALRNMYTRSKSDVATGIAKTWEIRTEFNSLKDVVDQANKELMIKDKAIELLKFESGTVKDLELKLVEKDNLVDKMKAEMEIMRASVAEMGGLMEEKRRRIEELEEALEKTRESEKKVFDSFVTQTAQLEQATILSEKLRLESVAVKEEWEVGSKQENERLREEIRRLEEDNDGGSGRRRRLSDTAKEEGDYCDEIDTLRNELKLSLEAEDRSKRAMDDLALALAEVAAEASVAKEQLNCTEEQVELLRNEVGNLKILIKNREEEHENCMGVIKRENETLKNTVLRLRVEAEESLLGWVGKEIEFVKCIKKAEDEKESVQEEKIKLMKSMITAEEKASKAKEENSKLRDIMKQALNEANAAKEAAQIAKSENSQLKDHLLEKEKALLALAQETERLRINETELKKQVLSKEAEAKEQQQKKSRRRGGSFSGEKELKGSSSKSVLPPLLPGLLTFKQHDDHHAVDKDDDLTDSIFDLIEEKRQPATATETAPTHLRRTSSAFSDDEKFNLDEFVAEHVEDKPATHLDDATQNKKKGLLLRRLGDLWKRKTPTPSPCPSPTPSSTPNPNPNGNPNDPNSQNQSPSESPPASSQPHEGAAV